QVVIELTSRKTSREDLQTKWQLYQELGVQEYFVFDPEYDYLDEPLIGYCLEGGRYVEQAIRNHRILSNELGLEFVDTGRTLRLLDPATGHFLPNSLEAATAQEQLQKAIQAEQEARQLAAELEATLARYRRQFGDLPK
ncbi:MAG TPA: Uma2 family endonuclease, partial [Blastocatellia bacterium]|nr:Uma2 family endonuclease [Blastocatellia bacterium]